MAEIDHFFQAMIDKEGSDLHLLEGQPPKIRQHGHVVPLPDEDILTADLLTRVLGRGGSSSRTTRCNSDSPRLRRRSESNGRVPARSS